MKQIIGFTKDLRQEVNEILAGENKLNTTVFTEMTLDNFWRLRCMVRKFLSEAEQKKDDAVATHQFYTELAEALENYSPTEEDCIESRLEADIFDAAR